MPLFACRARRTFALLKQHNMMNKQTLTVKTTIDAGVDKVWNLYNDPQAIMQWNQAADDWHCPASENDLKVGGRFKNTMAAKDGSFSFDFSGTYTRVEPQQALSYTMDDERKVEMQFDGDDKQTTVTTQFEAESQNPLEMQQQGWQAILNNFKNYVEKH